MICDSQFSVKNNGRIGRYFIDPCIRLMYAYFVSFIAVMYAHFLFLSIIIAPKYQTSRTHPTNSAHRDGFTKHYLNGL